MTEDQLQSLVKLNLRLTGSAFDAEIKEMIAEAESDISASTDAAFSLSDRAMTRAVVTYCRARFGAGDETEERLYQSMLAKIGIQSTGGEA